MFVTLWLASPTYLLFLHLSLVVFAPGDGITSCEYDTLLRHAYQRLGNQPPWFLSRTVCSTNCHQYEWCYRPKPSLSTGPFKLCLIWPFLKMTIRHTVKLQFYCAWSLKYRTRTPHCFITHFQAADTSHAPHYSSASHRLKTKECRSSESIKTGKKWQVISWARLRLGFFQWD